MRCSLPADSPGISEKDDAPRHLELGEWLSQEETKLAAHLTETPSRGTIAAATAWTTLGYFLAAALISCLRRW